MELFWKIVKGLHFRKISTLEGWQGSEYASESFQKQTDLKKLRELHVKL